LWPNARPPQLLLSTCKFKELKLKVAYFPGVKGAVSETWLIKVDRHESDQMDVWICSERKKTCRAERFDGIGRMD